MNPGAFMGRLLDDLRVSVVVGCLKTDRFFHGSETHSLVSYFGSDELVGVGKGGTCVSGGKDRPTEQLCEWEKGWLDLVLLCSLFPLLSISIIPFVLYFTPIPPAPGLGVAPVPDLSLRPACLRFKPFSNCRMMSRMAGKRVSSTAGC